MCSVQHAGVPADAISLRYFLSYSGVSLPLQLVEELQAEALTHRNTFFRAAYGAAGRMLWVEKLVYGEVEMRHDYSYDDASGALREVLVSFADEEPQVLTVSNS
jgi:hypothetical protein